jgi:hypothetical protein
MVRTSYIQCVHDYVCFVLEQHAKLDLYSAGSLKQQSAGTLKRINLDSDAICHCIYSLILLAQMRSSKY